MSTRKAKSKKAGSRAKKTAKKKPVGRKKAAPTSTRVAAKPAKKARAKTSARAPARKKTKTGKKRKSVSRGRRKGPLKKWLPFREALLTRQRELTQAYHASKGDTRNRLDDGTEDYIDYAVSSYAREFLLSLTEMDRKQLMLVEEAIRRIDTGGDYGRCLNCAQQIVPKRLKVAPWARYCVRCQELDDQGLLAEPGTVLAGDEDEDEDLDDVDYEGDEEEDYDEGEELAENEGDDDGEAGLGDEDDD